MFYKSSGIEYAQNDVDKVKNLYLKKTNIFVKKYAKKLYNALF